MQSETMRAAFGALSDPTRLRIVLFLALKQRDESVGKDRVIVSEEEICAFIAGPSSTFITITHDLYELEAAGLVTIGRRENQLTCTLRPFMFKALAAALIEIGS
jgi:DNA-binding transcriptional ArsR family regulator